MCFTFTCLTYSAGQLHTVHMSHIVSKTATQYTCLTYSAGQLHSTHVSDIQQDSYTVHKSEVSHIYIYIIQQDNRTAISHYHIALA